MKYAPIALFVYNRPWHTEQTLKALAENDLADESILYIFSDGPKHLALDKDVVKIEQVRELIRSKKWCEKVEIIESEHNKGLADSIVDGITDVINKYGNVIVLEDDLVTRKGFLRFMNEALKLYEYEEKVMQIAGYIYGTPKRSRNQTTHFLKILGCNGWGTWKRSWDHYVHDPDVLLSRLKKQNIIPKKFDIEGGAHFYKQLKANQKGDIYTWAVRWYASWLTAGGYSLFPHRSLLTNIGHDGSGVHGSAEFYNGETVDYIPVKRQKINENIALRKEIDQIWRKGRGLTLKKKLRTIIGRIKKKVYVAPLMVLIKLIRKIIQLAVPELRDLTPSIAQRVGLRSTAHNSNISKKAKIYAPYHINNSMIGAYTYIMPNNWISMANIGKFCSIGPGLTCGGGIHPTTGISTSPMFYSTKKQVGFTFSRTDKIVERKTVKIGNDVFIGMNVTILDGVTIGDGAVIGAGAVVSKDIPPYAIAVGNPIKVIRYRFSDQVIEKLLKIKWWDFDETKLQDVERYCFDVETFIAKHKNWTD
jgi:acetyltransferase-like isoleucine patch superfamily enzyme